jgi:hypothetical protein
MHRGKRYSKLEVLVFRHCWEADESEQQQRFRIPGRQTPNYAQPYRSIEGECPLLPGILRDIALATLTAYRRIVCCSHASCHSTLNTVEPAVELSIEPQFKPRHEHQRVVTNSR